MITVGVDVGSVAVKAVLEENGEWRDSLIVPTGWNPKESGSEAVERICEKNGITRRDVTRLVATGYGRNAVAAHAVVTEITCHALGALRLFSKDASVCGTSIRAVLDIGGQDSKVVAIDQGGNVSDFLMNDKCAAGTGRFLQNMAVMLGCDLSDFSELPEDKEPHVISSMCTVFAESEIVGLLAGGTDKEALALGILDAVASRAEGMLRRLAQGSSALRENGSVAFTGGASRSRNLVALLEKRLGCPVRVRSVPVPSSRALSARLKLPAGRRCGARNNGAQKTRSAGTAKTAPAFPAH